MAQSPKSSQRDRQNGREGEVRTLYNSKVESENLLPKRKCKLEPLLVVAFDVKHALPYKTFLWQVCA